MAACRTKSSVEGGTSLGAERAALRSVRQNAAIYAQNAAVCAALSRAILNIIGRCRKMRVKITLACSECKQRNYDTTKNKKHDPDRLEMN